MWGLPDREPQDVLLYGGSILILRIKPELSEALHAKTTEVTLNRLVIQILSEWAGVPEET